MLHLAAAHFKQSHLRAIFYNGMQKLVHPLVAVPNRATFQREKHTITYKPYVPKTYKDHDHKNMTLGRPMSPHLTVYAMTIPAGTSICQRISGVMLAAYGFLIAGGALFLPNGIESYVGMIQCLGLGGATAFLLKLILGLPFSYHYCNGIRFCLWNTVRLFTKKDLNSTAFKTLIGAGIIDFIFAIF